ncbi:substrate-binding domain-containing protein [Streptomyces sp. Edi4]|uniref:substrate-binding domain-containing protein n=1 Tax=Streptomyces sp. Edi4 TaxID=3162527 RepID=UPI0033067DAE
MGRHSLPDDATGASGGAARVATPARTVALALALVLAVAAGTAVAVERGLLSLRRSCEATAVRLDLVASPDVAPAVRAVADRARRERITSDGSCMDVRVSARDSFEVAASFASPARPDFSVWIPDASLWVDRAKDASANVLTAGHIATSPVALAAVPAAAVSLGWPAKTYGWAELATATARDAAPRLGMADPTRSASGLLALSCVGKSAASAGRGGGARAAALAGLLSRRVFTGDAQAVRALGKGGSGDTRALVLSEQAAFAYNVAHGGDRALRLFYPTDGAPQLDYPYAMVRETRMSTDESRAAMRFMTLLGDPESTRVLAAQGFRTPGAPLDGPLAAAAKANSPQPYASASAQPPSAQDLQDALGLWASTVRGARPSTVADTPGPMATRAPGAGDRTRRAPLRRPVEGQPRRA